MDKAIGLLNIYRDSDEPRFPDVTEYQLTDMPEYTQGEQDEKILLFSCINSKQESCYVAFSVADCERNTERYIELKRRIDALRPRTDGECSVIVHVYLCKPYLRKPRNAKKFGIRVRLSSDYSSPTYGLAIEFKTKGVK